MDPEPLVQQFKKKKRWGSGDENEPGRTWASLTAFVNRHRNLPNNAEIILIGML